MSTKDSPMRESGNGTTTFVSLESLSDEDFAISDEVLKQLEDQQKQSRIALNQSESFLVLNESRRTGDGYSVSFMRARSWRSKSCSNMDFARWNQQTPTETALEVSEECRALLSKVPFYDVRVELGEEKATSDRIISIVGQLAPWTREHLAELRARKMTGGITNVLYKVTAAGNNSLDIPTLLVRICGEKTELIIDREQEIVTLVCLSRAGLSPPLHGRFQNGLVYGYQPGITFTVEDMRSPTRSKLIAKHLAKFHTRAVVEGKPMDKATLFPTLHAWLNEVRQDESDSKPSVLHMLDTISFSLEKIERELTISELELSTFNSKIVYCHNDLLSGNIIYDAEASEPVQFIDFEYGNYNYRAFDIGNHFCEMMGFDVDTTQYPSEEHQIEWVKTYLEEVSILEGNGGSVTHEEIVKLHEEVNRYAILAHLFWGVWALIQHSNIISPSFNYLEYAKLRLSTYITHKAMVQRRFSNKTK